MTEAETAIILYIKRNSLDDGPGIRTTVFFKGCPLDCAWCHNPESKSARPELSFDPELCAGCGDCIESCPENALDRSAPGFIDRVRCRLCFSCADACPSNALSRLGEQMNLDQVLAAIEKDIPFYRTSGGGVTLSGGEPTLYMDFCAALLRDCKNLGIHTLIETCGMFDIEKFTALLYPNLDTIYLDIKIIDGELHKKYCGVGNSKILENAERLLGMSRGSGGVPVLPRVPLVPGVTDTDNNLAAAARFLKSCRARSVALLPYNPTWLKKSAMIGQQPAFTAADWMRTAEIARCRAHFNDFNIA